MRTSVNSYQHRPPCIRFRGACTIYDRWTRVHVPYPSSTSLALPLTWEWSHHSKSLETLAKWLPHLEIDSLGQPLRNTMVFLQRAQTRRAKWRARTTTMLKRKKEKMGFFLEGRFWCLMSTIERKVLSSPYAWKCGTSHHTCHSINGLTCYTKVFNSGIISIRVVVV